eukprot:CAMPEP_0118884036 /NCGR_PEP_ID=MMETSP1163-20130328/22981_1 /TAXON_ID=124430 /ORGANISM="Phaeomonas parva, Strain CCMP2877" /LENGTH=395 /DNA_ID=CAMNT_0006821671 /DNA_START=53 /DNA_END=1240 /DNA_ORIENTATION=+
MEVAPWGGGGGGTKARRPKFGVMVSFPSAMLHLALAGFLAGLLSCLVFRGAPSRPCARRVAGFLHVFAQGGEYERIVAEQIKQLDAAGLLGRAGLRVYYTAVGREAHGFAIDRPDFVKMEPAYEAHEEITLERMRQYCLREPDAFVFYFHTKGSFHPSSENENLRRLHMRVMGEYADGCMEQLDKGFNLCGLRFSAAPHFHVPGNFWWSKCSYVRDLVSPIEYRVRPPISLLALEGKCSHSDLGRKRFASEHWIALHPGLKAVDAAPAGSGYQDSYTWGYVKLHGSWEPDWQPAPRDGIFPGYYISYNMDEYWSLWSRSRAVRRRFVERWNDGCIPSIRGHRRRELLDIYGAAKVAGFADDKTTSHWRWEQMMDGVCTASPSLRCDEENVLRQVL